MAGNPQQLQASWSIPSPFPGLIQSYIVNCNNSASYTFDGSRILKVSVIIRDLQPFTVYECNVHAVTTAGNGPFSTTSTARTDEAGKIS